MMQVTNWKISLSLSHRHNSRSFCVLNAGTYRTIRRKETRLLSQGPQTSRAVARNRTHTGEQCPNQFSKAAATASIS